MAFFMKKRYCARLAYDGTGFCGFQIQDNAQSVQETIEKALSTIFSERISIIGCGRTDSGVHAKEFYCHFDASYDAVSSRLNNINGMLGERIVIKSIDPVDSSFHARFDALERNYEYHLHSQKNPFIKNWSFYMKISKDEFDSSLLFEAASLLLDFSDFNTFCKSKTDTKTTLCVLSKSQWIIGDHKMIYQISADRFLRGMVRLIVGAMLNIAMGKIALSDLKTAMEARAKLDLNWSVPAHGLYLTKITYPDSIVL